MSDTDIELLLWHKGDFALNVIMNVIEIECKEEKEGVASRSNDERSGIDKVLIPFGFRMRTKISPAMAEQTKRQIERELERQQLGLAQERE